MHVRIQHTMHYATHFYAHNTARLMMSDLVR